MIEAPNSRGSHIQIFFPTLQSGVYTTGLSFHLLTSVLITIDYNMPRGTGVNRGMSIL